LVGVEAKANEPRVLVPACPASCSRNRDAL
jgi:hypothetical protein